jgi:hypothetical protein
VNKDGYKLTEHITHHKTNALAVPCAEDNEREGERYINYSRRVGETEKS